jgi:hypothetical protein
MGWCLVIKKHVITGSCWRSQTGQLIKSDRQVPLYWNLKNTVLCSEMSLPAVKESLLVSITCNKSSILGWIKQLCNCFAPIAGDSAFCKLLKTRQAYSSYENKRYYCFFNLDFHLEMKIWHKKLSALDRDLKCDLYTWISTDVWEN